MWWNPEAGWMAADFPIGPDGRGNPGKRLEPKAVHIRLQLLNGGAGLEQVFLGRDRREEELVGPFGSTAVLVQLLKTATWQPVASPSDNCRAAK